MQGSFYPACRFVRVRAPDVVANGDRPFPNLCGVSSTEKRHRSQTTRTSVNEIRRTQSDTIKGAGAFCFRLVRANGQRDFKTQFVAKPYNRSFKHQTLLPSLFGEHHKSAGLPAIALPFQPRQAKPCLEGGRRAL